MKLFNKFKVVPRYLTAFNYAGKKVENITRRLYRENHLIDDYWERECEEHPTKQYCLVYYD
tara:strand:- start:5329 stop:5511 length:183 start_codon:yes stop_codon:yes gene_type:complete